MHASAAPLLSMARCKPLHTPLPVSCREQLCSSCWKQHIAQAHTALQGKSKASRPTASERWQLSHLTAGRQTLQPSGGTPRVP